MSEKWDRFKDNVPLLQALYDHADFSLDDMADFFDVSKSTVYYKFNEYNIKTRDSKARKTYTVPLNGKELYRLYVKEDYNMSDISRFYDVAPSTISRKLDKYNLKDRKNQNETKGDLETDGNEN